jgi:two-component system C4-dicarboxylate transport sensor histidine kinase DctB
MIISDLLKRHSKPVWSAVIVACLCLAYGVQHQIHRYYFDTVIAQGNERMRFFKSTLLASLSRYDYLPATLSSNAALFEQAITEPELASEQLLSLQIRSGSDTLYILNPDGLTIASSNWKTPVSFINNNYSFRPYFKRAMSQGEGRFYGIGATTKTPGFFVSSRYPRDLTRKAQAVAVVKVDLLPLAENWRNGSEIAFVTNEDGIVVLSSNNNWLYKTLRPLSPEQLSNIATQQQFLDEPLPALNLSTDKQSSTITLDGTRYVRTITEVGSEVGLNGWTLHYLIPHQKITEQTLSVWTKAIVILLGIIAILLGIRVINTRAALKTSQGESLQLRELNQSLEREIIERKQVEAALTKAQIDLRRTSKLRAMGQLSASITHELGQPLSAMRTYIATLQLGAARSQDTVAEKTLQKLISLVDRMTSVTHQLRYFARSGDKVVHRIKLQDTINGALNVTRPAIDAAGVDLRVTVPGHNIEIMAGEVRMEQVLINLIRNAIDAMENSDTKRLNITVSTEQDKALLSVSDTGTGLSEDTIKQLFEPFYTTKPSGIGMGLGLAISSNIIAEVGGTLTAENNDSGGSRFLVAVPLAHD